MTSSNMQRRSNGIPIEEAVLALHPPRVGRLSSVTSSSVAAGGSGSSADADHAAARSAIKGTTPGTATRRSFLPSSRSLSTPSLDVSSHHVSAASSPSGPTTAGGGKSRFSQLLLEHGERHLQDWAVVASSSSLGGSAAGASGAGSTRAGSSRRDGEKGKSKKSKKSRRSSSGKPRRSSSSKRASNERLPSLTMGAIPGRLRLCTRSIVFEPDDVTRGIVRCPFAKMVGRPRPGGAAAAASTTVSGGRMGQQQAATAAAAVVFQCNRHLVMKASNVIAPHDTIDVPGEFRFTFCHSNPMQFFDLTARLFGDDDHGQQQKQQNGSNGSGAVTARPITIPSPQAIDQLLKPMLDRPFDPHNLVDVREVPRTSNLRCHHLSPLQTQPGCSIVTDANIYFQPASGVLSTVAEPATAWSIGDIVAIARRYHGLRDCAVELYLSSGTSVLLAYETKRERERVLSLLSRDRKNIPCHTDAAFVRDAYEGWKTGTISNFDYLLALNSAAGRTFHDLSRYPVFPWVVADYTSEELDLTNQATFRDLTKPVGALNEERLQYFMTRYKGMEGDVDHDSFLYGTHYSAPGYVLYYLVRSMPEQMLCLQNGKFDAPDRMFHDLDHTYSSVLINHADVKELIAEFYDPQAGYDFLINARGLRLGTTQTGERVHDVKLPKWAKSPRDFLEKNRMALECDAVTSMLPRWIDLIFGDKSRGEGANDALNLFHPTAYLGSKDFEAMKTEQERMQAELQATEFGICPDLLFVRPHPLKSDLNASDDFIAPDPWGRAMSLEQLGDEAGEYSKVDGGDQPWELLEAVSSPPRGGFGSNAFESESKAAGTFAEKDNTRTTATTSTTGARRHASNPFDDEEPEPAIDKVESFEFTETNGHGHRSSSNGFDRATDSASARSKKLSLKGSGRGGTNSRSQKGLSDIHATESFELATANGPSSRSVRANAVELPTSLPSNQTGWERKPLLCQRVHGDAVSGCNLLVQDGPQQSSYLTSVSLDGRLLVHTLPFLENAQEQKRRSFSASTASTITRLSYLGLGSDKGQSRYTLNELRAHSSSDPLACLALTEDNAGGRIAFAGGHDDVVFAYGINSACALASVYSHRDAVTGVDLIKRSSFDNDAVFGTGSASSAKSTHIMVSGSWDATVKVWSVSVAAGETVSIDREPLAELFDADSSIVSVSATEVYGTGVAIAAGCSDGSLIVWLCHKHGGKEVLYKEEARRGHGACAAVKWAPGKFLFAASGNGRVASYLFKDGGTVRPVSRISVGSPVQCLALVEENLFVGCADGGLRMIPIGEGAHFDTSPHPWRDVNGETSPALTSLGVSRIRGDSRKRQYMCVSGADDGSLSMFELNEAK